ncbi:MAG: 7-cyano-7-deazaguanine synthase [Candidatus Omnitrophica bacterium]|nr:7-cyano-7-deazaguanine synthase [Candidatus Omnitrophota bacterium]
MKKVIVLTSGGIDSSVLALVMARRRYEVYPVFIRQGFVWENAEIFWLNKLLATVCEKLKPLTVLDFPVKDVYGGHWSLTGKKVPGYRSRDERVYLPGRNMFLISKAAGFGVEKGIYEIALGPLAGNPFPDSTRKFFNAMEKALSLGLGKRFRIHTPLLKLNKKQVLALGGKGFPFNLTFSCLKPDRRHQSCRRCNKCREKAKAFGG